MTPANAPPLSPETMEEWKHDAEMLVKHPAKYEAAEVRDNQRILALIAECARVSEERVRECARIAATYRARQRDGLGVLGEAWNMAADIEESILALISEIPSKNKWDDLKNPTTREKVAAEARTAALDEACKAVCKDCLGCKRNMPLNANGSHETGWAETPLMACRGKPIRSLLSSAPVTSTKEEGK